MPKFMKLKINNTKQSASTEKWKTPGADFYDQLLNAFYCDGDIPTDSKELEKKYNEGKYLQWNDFLKEAYLVAPINKIKNSPYGITPYSRSGCKYPHHIIKDGELVLSISGVRAAYARATQMGILKGDVKEHLERHYKELGIYEGSTMQLTEKIEHNFLDIESHIFELTGINLYSPTTLFSENANDEKSINPANRKDFVPIYGIIKSYSSSTIRNDGTPKTKEELSSVKFDKIIHKLTRGDNYSHALVSFDDSLTKMYSYEDDGFVVDNILEKDSWMGTKSIYICVMFVPRADRDRMKEFVKQLEENQDSTAYASANLLKAFVGTPYKVDKRFVCSSFTGYIMSCANPKNLHRDYSRLRPEDITILPRAFYVVNVVDREDFKRRKAEIRSKVNAIYDEYQDEIDDYNNHLPKLMLQDRCDKLKTIDKIFDWIIDRL